MSTRDAPTDDSMPVPGRSTQAAFVPERNVRVRVRRTSEFMYLSLADRDTEISESAAFLWRRIDGARTVSALATDLAAEYGIDRAEALADTSELISFLAGQHFVHAAGQGEVWSATGA